MTELAVGQDTLYGRGNEHGRFRGKDDPGIENGLGNCGRAVGDHRETVLHRLEQRCAEALVVRTTHEHVCARVVGGELTRPYRSRELDRVRQTQRGDKPSRRVNVCRAALPAHQVQTARPGRRSSTRTRGP